MKKAKQIITWFDSNPAMHHSKIGGMTERKNLAGGLCGIMYCIIFLIFIIYKCNSILEKQTINVQSVSQRDLSPINLDSSSFMLVLFQGYNLELILPQDQQLYGIEVLLIEKRSIVDQKEIPLVPCSEGSAGFCIPQYAMTLSCSADTVYSKTCQDFIHYDIVIRKCNPYHTFCRRSVQSLVLPALLMQSKEFNIYEKNFDQIFSDKSNMFLEIIFLDQNIPYALTIEISKVTIQNDNSIFPEPLFQDKNVLTNWFYPLQYTLQQDFQENFYVRYYTYKLIRSTFSETYSRSFLKIDTVLAEIMGFMGLIAFLITFCCSGYNNWLFQLNIEDKIIQIEKGQAPDKQKKQEYNSPTFKSKNMEINDNSSQNSGQIWHFNNNQNNQIEKPEKSERSDSMIKKQQQSSQKRSIFNYWKFCLENIKILLTNFFRKIRRIQQRQQKKQDPITLDFADLLQRIEILERKNNILKEENDQKKLRRKKQRQANSKQEKREFEEKKLKKKNKKSQNLLFSEEKRQNF